MRASSRSSRSTATARCGSPARWRCASSRRSPTRKSSRTHRRRILRAPEKAVPVSEGYRKSVPPSGIRVVTERMEHVRSVAVGVWGETGSRHEPEGRIGMSHLIEHLVFKGTETRTAQATPRTMGSGGGQMDALPTKGPTSFYVQGRHE